MKNKKQIFKAFLSLFPEVELPVTLTEDNLLDFSKVNKPFPQEVLNNFILTLESEEQDEFTEYIPCLRLPAQKDFHAVVYWRGKLMNYEFLIASFDHNGNSISRKSIAGIRADDRSITSTVATIDEDLIIHIVIGQKSVNEKYYNPENSLPMSMEILPTGDIIFSLQE